MKDALPHVCARPVQTLEFSFDPEACWPKREPSPDDGGSPLLRGASCGGGDAYPVSGPGTHEVIARSGNDLWTSAEGHAWSFTTLQSIGLDLHLELVEGRRGGSGIDANFAFWNPPKNFQINAGEWWITSE